MKEETITDELLIRYALGQLSEEEQERVEELMFEDRRFFERLLAVEDDLIDAYAGGRLTEDERRRFERRLLNSKEDRERVGFARGLAAYVSSETPSKRVRWFDFLRIRNPRILVPLAAALLIAIGALLVFQIVRTNDRLDEMRAEREIQEKRRQELEQQIAEAHSRNQQLLEELERERAQRETDDQSQPPPQAAQRGLLSFILTPGAVRDRSTITRLIIPPDTSSVRLQAVFREGDHPSYIAEIQTVEGRVLWKRAGLKSQKMGHDRAVTVTAPAKVFGEDDYILILNGVTPAGEEQGVGEYFFRVVRK